METDKKVELISALTSAITNCSLYSSEHPVVQMLSEKAATILNDLIGEKESMGVLIIQNDLVFDEEPVRDHSLQMQNFVIRMRRKGIDKLIFRKGVPPDEIRDLIRQISDPEGAVSLSRHISTGLLEVRIGDPGVDGISEDDLMRFKNDQLDKVKGVFSGMSRFKKLDIAGLEDIVTSFIAVLHRESNILNIMTPVRSYSEFTYTHATNVAILSMFQAESIGIKGDYLHDIGIASLLHDVGKMFVPAEILEKKGKLEPEEWSLMQKHPLYGAKYLLGLDNVPKIAVPAALEHHLGYDGSGYPETRFLRKKPHLCSQMVAIADVYDALRAKRPYKKDFEIVEILSILRKDAGVKFNPRLVENFIRNLAQTISFSDEPPSA